MQKPTAIKTIAAWVALAAIHFAAVVACAGVLFMPSGIFMARIGFGLMLPARLLPSGWFDHSRLLMMANSLLWSAVLLVFVRMFAVPRRKRVLLGIFATMGAGALALWIGYLSAVYDWPPKDHRVDVVTLFDGNDFKTSENYCYDTSFMDISRWYRFHGPPEAAQFLVTKFYLTEQPVSGLGFKNFARHRQPYWWNPRASEDMKFYAGFSSGRANCSIAYDSKAQRCYVEYCAY